MSGRKQAARYPSRALALACAAALPASLASAAGPIVEYQFTGFTLNPTTVGPNATASVFSYINFTPSQPPLNDPPILAEGGGFPDDPPFFIGQGDWFPSTTVYHDNSFAFSVSVPPGMALNATSLSAYINSRQGVLFDSQFAYSNSADFSNPTTFDTAPFLIPAVNMWNTFTASDAPITNGVGTYYFHLYGQIDPNGLGTISDLLNMSTITLNGSVAPYSGVTPMYWDPSGSGAPGSGGGGVWIGPSSWADGAMDYPWSNTLAEIANFGGASSGVVALGGNVIAANGINFTTGGYNITATSGQTLAVVGTITASAEATISAPLAVAGVLTKAGPATLTLAGPATAASVQIAAGTLALAGGGILSTSGVSSSGAGALLFNGGTLQLTTNTFTLFSGLSGVQVQNGGAVIDTNGHTVAFTQGLTPTPGSTGGLTKIGSGTLVFGGSGNVNVDFNAGSLIDIEAGQLTGSSSFQGLWTANLASMNIAAGATFDAVESGPTNSMQIDALTGAGTFRGGYFGVTTVTIGAAGGSGAFSGVLQDDPQAQLAVIKIGAGTQTFSGNNTYTGGTAVNGGTLKLIDQVPAGAAVSIGTGAVLEFNDVGRDFQTPITFSGGGTLRKTGAGNLILGGIGQINVNLSAGALIDVQGGTLTGSSSFDGNFTANQASLNIAAGATFDAVEAGLTSTMQIDALSGGGTFQGGYSGANNGLVTVTIGVANGSGLFSGRLQDDSGAHLAFVKSGSGTETFSGSNTYTGGTALNSGVLIAGSGGALPLGPITVGTNAQLQFTPGITRNTISFLSIIGNGKIDLSNDGLVINYGAASDPIANIKAYLAAGYKGDTWTGTGISSSAAALNANKFAVGYLDGANPADLTVHTVSGNEIIIKYTLAGDAFLENTVGFDDLVVVAQNFGFTGKDWAGGNFNYDPNGSVGFPDLVNVAQNFGFSSGVTTGSPGGDLSPAWQTTSVVPEPTVLAWLAVGVGTLARRRRPR